MGWMLVGGRIRMTARLCIDRASNAVTAMVVSVSTDVGAVTLNSSRWQCHARVFTNDHRAGRRAFRSVSPCETARETKITAKTLIISYSGACSETLTKLQDGSLELKTNSSLLRTLACGIFGSCRRLSRRIILPCTRLHIRPMHFHDLLRAVWLVQPYACWFRRCRA